VTLKVLEISGEGLAPVRLYIDREGGVSLQDCERVSREVAALLDVEDPIPCAYTLEVSSPGAERPLKVHADYERFNGKRVNIRYRSGPSETVVEGQLVAVDSAGIAVSALGVRGRAPVIVHIAWDDVVAGRLAVAI